MGDGPCTIYRVHDKKSKRGEMKERGRGDEGGVEGEDERTRGEGEGSCKREGVDVK